MKPDELNAYLESWCREDDVDFQPVYDHFFRWLWLYIRRVFEFPDHVCQDIAQEALIRWQAARQAGEIRSSSTCEAYLYRIARNRAFDYMRRPDYRNLERAGDVTDLCPNVAAKELDPEALVLHNERTRIVRKCLGKLGENYREVLILTEIEEKKGKQVAEILDIPENTVASRRRRARELLCGLLNEHGITGALYTRPYHESEQELARKGKRV